MKDAVLAARIRRYAALLPNLKVVAADNGATYLVGKENR